MNYFLITLILLSYIGTIASVDIDDCNSLSSCTECALREGCGWCLKECWDLDQAQQCLNKSEMAIIDETPGCNDNDPITVIGFDANEQLEYEMHMITCEIIEGNDKNDTNCDEQIFATTIWVKSANIDISTFVLYAKLNEISTVGDTDTEEIEYISREITDPWPPCKVMIRYGYVSSLSCPSIENIIEISPDNDYIQDENHQFEQFADDQETNNKELDSITILKITQDTLLNLFRELLPRVDNILYNEKETNISESDPNGKLVFKRSSTVTNDSFNNSKITLSKTNDFNDYDEWDNQLQPTQLNVNEAQEINGTTHHVEHASFLEEVALKSDRTTELRSSSEAPPSSYNMISIDIDLVEVDIVSNNYLNYIEELYLLSQSEYQYVTINYTLSEWRKARSANDDNDTFSNSFENQEKYKDFEDVHAFFNESRHNHSETRRRLQTEHLIYAFIDIVYIIPYFEYTLVTANLLGIPFKAYLYFEGGVALDYDSDILNGDERAKAVEDYTKNDKCRFDKRLEMLKHPSWYQYFDKINECCQQQSVKYATCNTPKETSDNALVNCIAAYIGTDAAEQYFRPKWDSWLYPYLPTKLKFCSFDIPEEDEDVEPFFATIGASLDVMGMTIINFGYSYGGTINGVDKVHKKRRRLIFDVDKTFGWTPPCLPVGWGVQLCFRVEAYLEFGVGVLFGVNDDGYSPYFGVEPYAAAGAAGYGYIDAVVVKAGVFIRGDLIRITLPAKVTFMNAMFPRNMYDAAFSALSAKKAWNFPEYTEYSIDFNWQTAVITAGLYWQHVNGFDCGCCFWCDVKWTGRKILYSKRFVLGGTGSTNFYKERDGFLPGDPISHITMKARIYSKEIIDFTTNAADDKFIELLDKLNINSEDYDHSDSSLYSCTYLYNRNNGTDCDCCTASNSTSNRRLLQTPTVSPSASPTTPYPTSTTISPTTAPTEAPSAAPTCRYPGYDHLSEVDFQIILYQSDEANYVVDEFNNNLLDGLTVFSGDNKIELDQVKTDTEAYKLPTPYPTPSPTPAPTDERYMRVEMKCDNDLKLYYSQDGVTDWKLILEGESEYQYIDGLVDRPCSESKLLFQCTYFDDHDYSDNIMNGGFIANLEFNNFTYPTNMVQYPHYYEILNISYNNIYVNNSDNAELINLDYYENKEEMIINNESMWVWPDNLGIDYNDSDYNINGSDFTQIWIQFAFRVTDADPCPLRNCSEFDWIKHDFDWNHLNKEIAPKVDLITFDIDEHQTLTIDLELEYIGWSSAGYYKSEYGFGTTFVLDFSSFNAEISDITKPGTCSNRYSFDYNDVKYENWWRFSWSPYGKGHLGSTKYLAYPPAGSFWDIYSSDEYNEFSEIGCTKFHYFGKFSVNALLNCQNYEKDDNYIDYNVDDNWINVSGTFYVNLVSPVSTEFDLGAYRVYQLISKPFTIAIARNIHLSSTGGIALFQLTFISIYKQDGDLRIILLTESVDYLMLDDIFLVQYPIDLDNDLSAQNLSFFLPNLQYDNNGTLIDHDDTVIENDCIHSKNGICLQLWEIQLASVLCPTDLNGDYTFSFTTLCNYDVDNSSGIISYCEEWKDEHDKYDSITMTTPLKWNDAICETRTFVKYYSGEMRFYLDEEYQILNELNGLYLINKDRIFVEVFVEFPNNSFSNIYDFDIELNNVWLCSTNYLDDPLLISSQENIASSGCFSDNVDNDKGRAPYHIISNGKELTSMSNESLTHEIVHIVGGEDIVRFSFICPDTVTRDTLYIHTQITITMKEYIPEGVERRLLSQNAKTSSFMKHLGDNIGITDNDKLNYKNSIQYKNKIKQHNNTAIKFEILSFISLTLLLLFICILYIGWIFGAVDWFKNRMNKYTPNHVGGDDDESDESEVETKLVN